MDENVLEESRIKTADINNYKFIFKTYVVILNYFVSEFLQRNLFNMIVISFVCNLLIIVSHGAKAADTLDKEMATNVSDLDLAAASLPLKSLHTFTAPPKRVKRQVKFTDAEWPGIVFGRLVHLTSSNSVALRCEAVLVGPRHVLTVFPECNPLYNFYKNRLDPVSKMWFYFSKDNSVNHVPVISTWRKDYTTFMIALLHPDVDFGYVEFPILSWLGDPDVGDYRLFVERALGYPMRLVFRTETSSVNVLGGDEFTFGECLKRVKLESTSIKSHVMKLNGASFCKRGGNDVRSLVSLSSRLARCWSQPWFFGDSSVEPTSNNRNYVCGHRWNWQNVRDLYEIGLSVDPSFPRDDVIPDGTIGKKPCSCIV